MAQTIELPDVVSSAVDAALQGVWTAMPGRVEKYFPGAQSANVQLVVKARSVGESGDVQAEEIATLTAVPVLHVGGGGFRVVCPVATGDTCLVVFASRSIDKWTAQGGIVDPATEHHHDISDGVAIVGLRDYKHLLKNAPTDRLSLGHDAGATIEISQSKVRVGGNTGTEPPHKGHALNSALESMFRAVAKAFTSLPGNIGVGAGADVAQAILQFVLDADTALATVTEVK
jgi:hypothetical protein